MKHILKKSKEGIICKSPFSNKIYRVFEWKELDDGKKISIRKKEIEIECDELDQCELCDWNDSGHCDCWECDIETMRSVR